MDASIVIRTYNERRHLPELLDAIFAQKADFKYEVIVVDSGSTDGTPDIARQHGCRLLRISKREFTFGRSLNLGCDAALGKVLVFVSGHCVPCNSHWLTRLIEPIHDEIAAYSYGRQLGRDGTKFSERQVFAKYFPKESRVPQTGCFCNNANAALLRMVWTKHRFNEALTGLEDLMLAKQLTAAGEAVAYVAEAPVYHMHDESWRQVRMRYEREALALREIMPEIQIGVVDFLRYFASGVVHDLGVALKDSVLFRCTPEIVAFRWMQFWGTYRGNREHRHLSAQQREEYFYPALKRKKPSDISARRSSTLEGS